MLEHSFSSLYKSTVDAFPNTTKRQHVTGPIEITQLSFLPFLGMKTLFIKSEAVNEDRHYTPMALFRKVQYGEGRASIIAKDDHKKYKFEQLNKNKNELLVRCNCADYYWRFNWFNHLEQCHYGTKRKKYEALYRPDSSNPMNAPGLCKHLIKLIKTLENMTIIER